MERPLIIGLIDQERERQVGLGWTPAHDRGHSRLQWMQLLGERFAQAISAAELVVVLGGDPAEYRRRMVELAAVAVAALEAER